MLIRTLLAAACGSTTLLAQSAFLVDSDQDLLYSVDLSTGAVISIGSTLNGGLATPADLCWRDDTNELWTVDLAGGEAGTIDPATGAFTAIWQTNLSGWQAMAWDHTNSLFYLHNQSDLLYSLDPASGMLTQLGAVTPASVLLTSLEVDALGRLWTIDFSGGSIIQLNKTNGQPISSGPNTITSVQGLSFDAQGVWYGVSTNNDALYTIDPATGVATLVGPNAGTTFVKGMAITGTAVQRGGRACADGGGVERRMLWSGNSNLGATLQFDWESGPGTSIGVLAFGVSSSQFGLVPLPLELTPFGAPGCRLYHSFDVTGPLSVAGVPFPFAVPPVPTLLGVNVFAQGILLDGTPNPNALGLVFTDALKFTVVP